VNLNWKNPKHLYPKLNGSGNNGQWILKLSQLLHTYWLANSYWNWQEYVFYGMSISVLNIKVTCEWHKAINWTTKTLAILSYLSFSCQVLYIAGQLLLSRDVRAKVQNLRSTDQVLTHTKVDVSYGMIFYYNNL